MTHNLSTKSEQ